MAFNSRAFLSTLCMLAGCTSAAPPRSAAAMPPPSTEAARSFDRDPFPSTYHRYPGTPTLLTNVTIFDGEGGRIEHGQALFADGKVVAIGQGVAAPAGAVTIDGTGKWLTPGVIDIHSHLGDYPSPTVAALADGNEVTGPVETPRITGQLAGNLVALTKVPGATGLDWGHALAAISARPADALGLGGEIGSLLAGRPADVVVWDGDPLELESAPVAMWIDGIAQPLADRQTRLRDRYRDPVPEALPKAYDH